MWLKRVYQAKMGDMSGRQVLTKTALVFLSSAITAFGVGLFICSGLGSDSISVWLDGLDHTFHIGIGTASLLTNTVTLSTALLFCRRFVNVGTAVMALFFAWVLGLCEPWMRAMAAAHAGLSFHAVMVVAGLAIMIFGWSFTVSLRFGFDSTDAILFEILLHRPRWQYRFLKIALDGTFITAGFLLGGVVGIGTVMSFLLTGPGVGLLVPHIDRLILRSLGVSDPQNQQMDR